MILSSRIQSKFNKRKSQSQENSSFVISTAVVQTKPVETKYGRFEKYSKGKVAKYLQVKNLLDFYHRRLNHKIVSSYVF